MPSASHPPRRPVIVLAASLVVLAAALGACSGSSEPAATTTTAAAARPAAVATEEQVQRGPIHVDGDRLVDDQGRQVLLHGIGVDAWTEYAEGGPDIPTVSPVDDTDWDAMAARGVSVVRMAMSWSALEPIDADVAGKYHGVYLDDVGHDVDAAAERGISTIIDLHQDGWGASLATPPGTTCPAGTAPTVGGTGAPDWATVTDGASTCRPDDGRSASPAQQAAFRALYEDRNGLRGKVASVWHRIAADAPKHPGIIGYDLFDEPAMALPATEQPAAYTELLRAIIGEIRAAEDQVDADPMPVFVEPIAGFPEPGTLPDWEALGDDQVVFAPHLDPSGGRAEIADQLDAAQEAASAAGLPLWIGAFGLGEATPASVDDLAALLDDLDDLRVGWAWCHGPQAVSCPGGEATPDEALLRQAGRPYPRLAPGTLEVLASDPDAGTLRIGGSGAEVGQELVVWLADHDGATPDVGETHGLATPTVTRVRGGAILTAEATAADWSLSAAPG